MYYIKGNKNHFLYNVVSYNNLKNNTKEEKNNFAYVLITSSVFKNKMWLTDYILMPEIIFQTEREREGGGVFIEISEWYIN